MSQIINKSAPTVGGAIGYFTVLYFIVQGDIPKEYHPEAVVMAGVVFTHVFWELGSFRTWLVRIVEKAVEKRNDKMIAVGSIVKWLAILSALTIIGTGIKKGYEYHLDQIDMAVNSAKDQLALDKQDAVRLRETELRQESKQDLERIERDLRVERSRVNNLQRMLLIDHDLDRLLQQKPGLILIRVNKGTEQYFKDLEVATQ